MSSFVTINVVYGGDRYTADVDADAGHDELLRGLIRQLELKPGEKYELSMTGDVRLSSRVTVEIRLATGENTVRSLRKVD